MKASPFLALLLLLHSNFASITPFSKIDPLLQAKLLETGNADIFVSMKVGTEPALHQFSSPNYEYDPSNHGSMAQKVVSALVAHADQTQKTTLEFLSKTRKPTTVVESFWISNQIFVKNADSDLVLSLSEFDDIAKIELQLIIPLPIITEAQEVTENILAGEPWGIQNVKAPEVWKMQDGNAGEGVIVAIIDTGVRATHQALRDNFRGKYGWFDPYQGAMQPVDMEGHGTHVTGTIVGKSGIGVAPNATWMACRGCNTDGCAEFALLACGQFVLAPTLADGTGKNSSMAPHIVSNSWGGDNHNTFYESTITAWKAAGIIPVFASGNAGPGCSKVGSPGDSKNVISVGATNSQNALAQFSSVGPSVTGLIKPDVSAPGQSIRSAWNSSDTGYETISGTSMATPHVAGVIALLKAASPGLTYQQVMVCLAKGAERKLTTSGNKCGTTKDTAFPNNFFGEGKINALNSMQVLKDGGHLSSAAGLVPKMLSIMSLIIFSYNLM